MYAVKSAVQLFRDFPIRFEVEDVTFEPDRPQRAGKMGHRPLRHQS